MESKSSSNFSNFCSAVEVGFTNASDFCGRASKSEFWWWVLFYILVALVVGLVPVVNLIVHLVLFIPSLSVLVRRLHDIDFSGWWALLVLIPFFGALILLYFCYREGDARSNRFGDRSTNKCQ